ncbi:MAG: 30S ribosomal protein S9 [Chloroflexi bacterium]|nr:30S ribosomal protein S9 [Chloroflexota bacterium]
MTTEPSYYFGTGRRKCSIARVRLFPGDGTVKINDKRLQELYSQVRLRDQILQPLTATNLAGRFNVVVKVLGGGIVGQAGAIRHGIARALLQSDETLRPTLRKGGFLTRDSRVKERKKYGLKRARKAPQYTKR